MFEDRTFFYTRYIFQLLNYEIEAPIFNSAT